MTEDMNEAQQKIPAGNPDNSSFQGCLDKIMEQQDEIAKLKDILIRATNYNLDDYNMTLEDVKGECPLGLFTHGYWRVLLEAREATNK